MEFMLVVMYHDINMTREHDNKIDMNMMDKILNHLVRVTFDPIY